MTRIRILQLAKKLITEHYLPLSHHRLATTAVGENVAYCHPDAVNFSLVGAIERAIYNSTGDDYNLRGDLYEASIGPLITRLGGRGPTRVFLEIAPEKAIHHLLDEQLKEWLQ